MNESEQENKKATTNSNLDIKLWAVGSVLFILMSVFGYLAYLNLHFPLTDRGNYATLGDSFGILSSLFSGLAFAGLIVTIVMQNKTMKAQMEELELARKEYQRQGDELQGQKDVMNKQFEAIQIQQFETTFFKMIDNHRAIINGYKINGLDGYGYIKDLNSDSVDYFKLSKIDLEQKSLCKVYFLNIIRLVELVEKNKEYLEKVGRFYFYYDILKDGFSIEEFNFLFFLNDYFREMDFFKNILEKGYFFNGYMMTVRNFKVYPTDDCHELMRKKYYLNLFLNNKVSSLGNKETF